MADVFTLSYSGATVNFLDSTKYKTMIPGGEGWQQDPIVDEDYTQQRDGQMMLKTYIVYGDKISMDFYAVGTNGSYNAALANKAAVKDQIDKAVAGTAVTLTFQRFDQGTAEVYTVLGGQVKLRNHKGLVSKGQFLNLTMTVVEA